MKKIKSDRTASNRGKGSHADVASINAARKIIQISVKKGTVTDEEWEALQSNVWDTILDFTNSMCPDCREHAKIGDYSKVSRDGNIVYFRITPPLEDAEAD